MFAAKNELFTTPSGYQIQRSLRFRSSASAYLTRTPASTSNRTTWTFSAWIKRGGLAGTYGIFGSGTDNGATRTLFWINSSDKIIYQEGNTDLRTSVAVFRDPSAWGHLVLVIDNGNATAANRILIYWNGVLQTTTGTGDPGSTQMNLSSVAMKIGTRTNPPTSDWFDGYLTEINFIDGQALTPSSFGAINAVTGVWSATKYAGTYGTNGFYLNFTDNSAATATTIGKDYSGNGNNWTPNNISVTAGATYDSMLDVPLGAGGGERGNYCVGNHLQTGGTTWSSGNLNFSLPSGTGNGQASIAVTTGKWYWEMLYSAQANDTGVQQSGVTSRRTNAITYSSDGSKYVNGTNSVYGATYTTGDVISVALDMDGGTVTFYKNNASQGSISLSGAGITEATATISAGGGVTTTGSFNFGQRPFSYTPPTGFKALHTGNLAAPVIALPAQNMAATLYTGTGASLTVANTVNSTSFQPDWVWVKGRSGATDHALYDSVRGVQKQIESNTTTAETTETTGLTAFGSTGFTVGALAQMNTSAATYVAWQWKAGGTAVSNTAGSITSSVSANTTAGFSVVTYTGTGSLATVGHGLGVAPAMMIIKTRSAVNSWVVYHQSLGNTKAIYLNLTGAADTNASFWNNTSPTSSVLTVNTDTICNQNGTTYVAYCYAQVAGYSAFGSYTGNGSADGPFVFTGMRPRFIMWKRTDTTSGWSMHDTSRDPYNISTNNLFADSSGAEDTGDSIIDLLSNGFKLRNTYARANASGGTYIYMAFAESPFKNSLAR